MRRRGSGPSSRLVALAVATCLAVPAGAVRAGGPPPSGLEVLEGTRWAPWWDSSHAPARWPGADVVVAGAVAWRPAAAGMERGELPIGWSGEPWRLTVVLVRLDPARVRMQLVRASREGGTLADWSLDRLPPGAVLGVNAGQFTGGQPWGWLVRNGRVEQPPGTGSLSMAFAVRPDGRAGLVPVGEIPAAGAGSAVEAFQSYPALLRRDGEVPRELGASGLGIDLSHRDSRLAIGELRDGRLVIALTRLDAGTPALASLPFGPTAPEMAAILGALGCRQAMMLDGGISAQLAVRDAGGLVRTWRGWRKVPLALVAYPR